MTKAAKKKEEIRVRSRANEEHDKLAYYSVLFKATSIKELLQKLSDVSEIIKYDKKLEEDYIEARETVERVKAEYEATKAELDEKKAELEAKKAELEKEIEIAKAIENEEKQESKSE